MDTPNGLPNPAPDAWTRNGRSMHRRVPQAPQFATPVLDPSCQAQQDMLAGIAALEQSIEAEDASLAQKKRLHTHCVASFQHNGLLRDEVDRLHSRMQEDQAAFQTEFAKAKADFEQTLQRTQAQVNSLNDDLTAQSTRHESAQTECRNKLIGMQEQLNITKEELDTTKEELSTTQQERETVTRMEQQACEQLEKVNGELGDARAAITARDQSIGVLEVGNAEGDQTIASLKEEITKKDELCQTIKQEHSKLVAELESAKVALLNEVTTLTDRCSSLSEQADAAHALREETQRLKTGLTAKQNALDKAQADLEDEVTTVKMLSTVLGELDSKLQAGELRIQTLQRELDEQKDKHGCQLNEERLKAASFHASWLQCQTTVNATQKELQAVKQQLHTTGQERDAANENETSLRKQLSNLESEHKELENCVEEKKRTIQAQASQILKAHADDNNLDLLFDKVRKCKEPRHPELVAMNQDKTSTSPNPSTGHATPDKSPKTPAKSPKAPAKSPKAPSIADRATPPAPAVSKTQQGVQTPKPISSTATADPTAPKSAQKASDSLSGCPRKPTSPPKVASPLTKPSRRDSVDPRQECVVSAHERDNGQGASNKRARDEEQAPVPRDQKRAACANDNGTRTTGGGGHGLIKPAGIGRRSLDPAYGRRSMMDRR